MLFRSAVLDIGSGRADVALLTYGAVARSSSTSIGTGAKYSEMGPPDPTTNMQAATTLFA